jgi:hypothetical protein
MSDNRILPRHATTRAPQPRRALPATAGFVLAALAGALGLCVTIALWITGAPLLLVLACYCAAPSLLVAPMGYVALRRAPRRAHLRRFSEAESHV